MHEARERVARLAVAIAAEVDARQDDLAVPLLDTAPHLTEDGRGAAASRRPAHERDDTEGAREAAPVLDFYEGADAVEAGVGLDAADRPDVARDELGRLFAPTRDDDDVFGQP